jgi:hypothetical protein
MLVKHHVQAYHVHWIALVLWLLKVVKQLRSFIDPLFIVVKVVQVIRSLVE